MTALAPTLQAFFTDRLTNQLGASPHTIAAYRDTFRLLLAFAATRTGTRPSGLDLADLDATLIGAFLDHLETSRHNSVATRNHRLAAIRSLFTYAARRHPEHAADIARVLAIQPKRFQRNLVTYLTEQETQALLNACNKGTWTGRRDHAMLVLAAQTGLRVSELIGLTCADVILGTGAHVRCTGKGRRQRATPLTPVTVNVLAAWLAERGGSPADPLFPTITGRPLSRDAIEHRISHYTARAAETRPSLRARHVTAHTLRHTAVICTASGARGTAIPGVHRNVAHKYPPPREQRTPGPGPGSFFFDALFGLMCLTCLTLQNGHLPGPFQNSLQITLAMRLLHAGVDQAVIALWLGHAQVATTDRYMPDMTQKERALARTQPLAAKPGRYQPPDPILAFLESL